MGQIIKLIRQYLQSAEVRFWKNHRSAVKPSIFQHDYLLHIALSKDIKDGFAFIRKKDKRRKFKIIDIGCGQKPYYEIFKPFALQYIGVDPDVKVADIVGVAEKLPFPDNQFDLALCFQVLEHTSESVKAISEIYRILKKGGFALISTHGIWMYHPQPHDYYRWTKEGLVYLFRNFSQTKVKPNSRTLITLLQMTNLQLYSSACRNFWLKLPLYILITLLNILGGFVTHLGQSFLSLNYTVISRK